MPIITTTADHFVHTNCVSGIKPHIFTCLILFNLHNNPIELMHFLSHFKMRGLRLREVTQVEAANTSVLTSSLMPELAILTTRLKLHARHWETRVPCLGKTAINQGITKITVVWCFSEELTLELIEAPSGVSLVREIWQLLGEPGRKKTAWGKALRWEGTWLILEDVMLAWNSRTSRQESRTLFTPVTTRWYWEVVHGGRNE